MCFWFETDEDDDATASRNEPRPFTKVPAVFTPDKTMTLSELQHDFDKCTDTWVQSSCREKFLRILKRNQSDAILQITTVVCLATGSFSSLDRNHNERHMLQFACAVDTAREIAMISGNEVQIYAQDPQYTEMDKALCADKGITILDISYADIPQHGLVYAKEHFGQTTLLFEFCMDMGCEEMQQLMQAGNRIQVGTPFLRHARDGWSILDGQSWDLKVLAESFQKEHARRWFPNFEEVPDLFSGLMIHWKESQDSDLEGHYVDWGGRM